MSDKKRAIPAFLYIRFFSMKEVCKVFRFSGINRPAETFADEARTHAAFFFETFTGCDAAE